MQDDLLHPRNVPALPSLSFRRFRGEDDFPRMVAVFYAGKEADRDDRTFSAEDMARWYAHLTNCDPYQDVILAEVDGEVVGYGRACWLQETTGARVYLHEGHVAPAWRRRGIGGALLGWLQHRLRLLQQNGMSEAALGVDSENLSGALSLYEGLGFRRVKRWSCYRKPLATP